MSQKVLKTTPSLPKEFVMPEIVYGRVLIDDDSWNKSVENSSDESPQGDCREASMKLKVKLSGIGAVRVRGGLTSRFLVGNVDENTPDYFEHFWVEAKGLVYDWSQGKNLVMKKDVWYDLYKIKSVEIGFGILGRFNDEDFGLTKKEYSVLEIVKPKIILSFLDCFFTK